MMWTIRKAKEIIVWGLNDLHALNLSQISLDTSVMEKGFAASHRSHGQIYYLLLLSSILAPFVTVK